MIVEEEGKLGLTSLDFGNASNTLNLKDLHFSLWDIMQFFISANPKIIKILSIAFI